MKRKVNSRSDFNENLVKNYKNRLKLKIFSINILKISFYGFIFRGGSCFWISFNKSFALAFSASNFNA